MPPALWVVPVLPRDSRSLAVASHAFLQRLECLVVDASDDAFSIRLFLHHEFNRLPCNQSKASSSVSSIRVNDRASANAARPDASVARSFGEFAQLRQLLLDYCEAHGYVPCVHPLFRYLLFDPVQPTVLSKVVACATQSMASRLLTQFLSRLVQFARAPSATSASEAEKIAIALHQFLHGEPIRL